MTDEISNQINDEATTSPDDLSSMRKIAWVLDSSIPLPSGFRIGIDSLIGLVPGLGDAAGTALSGYLIFAGAKRGASIPTLCRMLFNTAVESVVGVIPFIGDLFDMGFKANLRNVNLLIDEIERKDKPLEPRSPGQLAVLVGIPLLLSIILIIAAVFFALGKVAGWLL